MGDRRGICSKINFHEHVDSMLDSSNGSPVFVRGFLMYRVECKHKLRRILDFERSRNQRQSSEFFQGKCILLSGFPLPSPSMLFLL